MNQSDTSDSIVVYYYADPSYREDINPTINNLRKRGFRVVKGDNADELLFLLQVGRPAAVIYTLASKETKSFASYQMVTRRALDLLVPLILIGPNEPNDGVLLLYPQGTETIERHIPYNAIPALIAKFDQKPPSTPSRPPATLNKQTMGKGRTMLNWSGGDLSGKPPIENNDPLFDIDSANRSEKSTEAAGANDKKKSSVPSSAKFAGGTQAGLPQVSSLTEKSVDIQKSSAESDVLIKSTDEMFAQNRLNEQEQPKDLSKDKVRESKKWMFVAGAAAVGSLFVIAAVVFIYLRDVERRNLTVVVPVGNKTQVLQESKTATISKGVAPEKLPSLASKNSASSDPDGFNKIPKQRDKHRPLKNLSKGDAIPFPGHFRVDTATFWFMDTWDEQRFVEILKNRRQNSKIKIVGHSTKGETAQGNGNIGLSRAWAVEKYLVREGFEKKNIEVSRGKPVSASDDVDDKGFARNRWVDIVID